MKQTNNYAKPGKIYKINITTGNKILSYFCIKYSIKDWEIEFTDKYDEFKCFNKNNIFSIEEVDDILKLNPESEGGAGNETN